MNSCIKLVLFYLLILGCLYVIYQLCSFDINEKKNNNLMRINCFKLNIIFGIFILIFLNYNFLFNQKNK